MPYLAMFFVDDPLVFSLMGKLLVFSFVLLTSACSTSIPTCMSALTLSCHCKFCRPNCTPTAKRGDQMRTRAIRKKVFLYMDCSITWLVPLKVVHNYVNSSFDHCWTLASFRRGREPSQYCFNQTTPTNLHS